MMNAKQYEESLRKTTSNTSLTQKLLFKKRIVYPLHKGNPRLSTILSPF